MTKDATNQYLQRYAEPEQALAAALPEFTQSLLVPACGEGTGLQPLLDSIPFTDGTLLAVLVNARADAPRWVHEKNQDSVQLLTRLGDVASLPRGATLIRRNPGTILLLQRTPNTQPIPSKQGVGLSRKILGDVALSLWNAGKLHSPWLRMTDADAELPSSYFSENTSKGAAFLHPFRHRAVEGFEASIDGYEAHLHAYVAGLDYANSPYAFHTVGSTIEAHATHYAAVRGMPRREAGEDFYFLNKLAKVGAVIQGSGQNLLLSGRPSPRVPFGTGQGVRARGSQRGTRYDHRCYEVLRCWLQEACSGPDDLKKRLQASLTSLTREEVRKVLSVLDGCGALTLAAAVAERASETHYVQRFHERFDAFATMKLIRRLTDDIFPQVAIMDGEPNALRKINATRLKRQPRIGPTTR